MTVSSARLRRVWRDVFRAATALSAVMLGVSVVTAMSAGALPAGTAPWPGLLFTVPASATASSNWQLNLSAPLPAVSSATVSGTTYTVTFASAAHNLVAGYKVSLSGFEPTAWNVDNLTVQSVSGAAVTVTGFATAPTANATTLGTASSITFKSCPGDGIAGFRWTTFMVPAAVDVATLTYNTSGPIAPAGVTFAQPLYSSSGSPQVAKVPAVGDGLITGIPANFSFSALVGSVTVPNGQYKIGYACTKDGAAERYWQTGITVSNSTSTGFDFAQSALTPVTTTTTTTSTTTSTTVAPTTTTTTTTTTTVPLRPAVTNLVATPSAGQIIVSWSAPTVTPTGYLIGFALNGTPIVGSPFNIDFTLTTFTRTGLAAGTYTVTVTPTHVGATALPNQTTAVVPGGSTSTTVAGTTTTVSGSTTTTVVGAGGPTTTVKPITLPGLLPATGSSATASIVFWSLLLLVFGRMAILFARPMRVLPAKQFER